MRNPECVRSACKCEECENCKRVRKVGDKVRVFIFGEWRTATVDAKGGLVYPLDHAVAG